MENVTQNRHAASLSYALGILKRPEYKQWIEAIYLYGSCARRTQGYFSDVDLLIRVKEGADPKLLLNMRREVSPDTGNLPEVELKFAYNGEFSSSEQFNKNIEKEGILLWQRQ